MDNRFTLPNSDHQEWAMSLLHTISTGMMVWNLTVAIAWLILEIKNPTGEKDSTDRAIHITSNPRGKQT